MNSNRMATIEEQRENWEDTARQYARNADYWRDRALRAERFTFQRLWWAATRWVHTHITAREP